MTIQAPRIKRHGFFPDLLLGLWSLLKGMRITLRYLLRPSTVVTQQYPENRETLKLHERVRSHLAMPHDAAGKHKCTSCRICEKSCPNGSIRVVQRKNETTGKMELDRYAWRMDSCIFCGICVQSCPFNAIAFTQEFESSVYDKRLLVFNLNRDAGCTAYKGIAP